MKIHHTTLLFLALTFSLNAVKINESTIKGSNNLQTLLTKNRVQFYLNSLTKTDQNGKELFKLGCSFYKKNEFSLAEEAWLQAKKKKHTQAMANLGLLYQEQKKNDLAEKHYLLALGYDNKTVLNNLGVLYYRQNKLDLAEKYYLLAIDHNSTAAMCHMGILYTNQNKFELAEKYFLSALEKGNNSLEVLHQIGYAYQSQDKFNLAEKYYRKGADRGCLNSMNSLGFIYYKHLGQIESAKKILKKAIDQNYMRSYYHLGNIYKQENKLKKAIECYQKCALSGDQDAQKALLELDSNK